jgi:hypothetical protein
MKLCEDFTLNFGNKGTGFCTITMQSRTSFFTGEFFYQKTTHPTRLTWPPATFLFPQLKGHHFDTIKVMQGDAEHPHRT